MKTLAQQRSDSLGRCEQLQRLAETRALTEDERAEFRENLDRAKLAKFEAFDNRPTADCPTRADQIHNRPTGGPPIAYLSDGTPVPYVGETSRDCGNGTYHRFGTFLQHVAKAGVPGGHVTPELQQRSITGMGEAVGSEGGFLVSNDESSELLQRVFAGGAIASRIRRLPPLRPGTNGVALPYLDEVSRATGSRLGGVQTFWADEAELLTGSKPKIGKLELNLKKLTGICYTSDELLEDAAQLGNVIAESFRQELTFSVEDAVFRGSGAGRPLGFLQSGCKITTPKESTQASDTIVFDNIASMLARLSPSSMANAVWLANVSVLPQLLKMSIPISNRAGTDDIGGSSGVGMVFDASNSRLLGKPVLFVEYAAALGDEGDICLVDLGQYLWIDRLAQSASSIHVRFSYAETAFRFVYRCDGQPSTKTALVPYMGTATTSPFITLQAR